MLLPQCLVLCLMAALVTASEDGNSKWDPWGEDLREKLSTDYLNQYEGKITLLLQSGSPGARQNGLWHWHSIKISPSKEDDFCPDPACSQKVSSVFLSLEMQKYGG